MADIAAISTILTSVKTATDIAKLLKNSSLSLEDAEAKLNLADIISSLADARLEIAEVREILLEKDQRIKELEYELTLQTEMTWCGTVYYRVIEGKRKEGPFCPQCYDSSNKMIRLQKYEACWYCLTCKQHFSFSCS